MTFTILNDCPSIKIHSKCLNMSKAFDRVWDESLIYKFKTVGISDNSIKLLKTFLETRYETESYLMIKVSVSQRSIFSPLLFLIYIHDLPNIKC